jgi:Spy/CpxP family protein refolding chaperone
MQQMRQSHIAMSKLETSDTFNEAQVRAAASQQAQVITELLVQKARIKSEMVQVLTADQKAKLVELQAKHELRMQQHMQKMQAPPTEPPAN